MQQTHIEEEETMVGTQQEEEEYIVNEIDKLEQHGINMADINKLKAAGICTVMAVLMW